MPDLIRILDIARRALNAHQSTMSTASHNIANANTEGYSRTLRIDSKMLAQAESDDPSVNKQQAAEDLRRIVATIGKPGRENKYDVLCQ